MTEPEYNFLLIFDGDIWVGERKKTVILEIDPPNDEVSVRRKAFYERAGYKS